MRTTVTFAPDVAAELERLRREQGLGVSEAVNLLVRQGMRASPERHPFANMTADLGLTVDVTNIGEVLDLLDQYEAEERSARDQRHDGAS